MLENISFGTYREETDYPGVCYDLGPFIGLCIFMKSWLSIFIPVDRISPVPSFQWDMHKAKLAQKIKIEFISPSDIPKVPDI